MRFAFRWAFRFLILIIVLLVALVLIKDHVIKSLAERRIRQETGMEVRIGKFETSLLAPTITIENLRLYNTEEFGGSTFVDLPELHFEYDAAALAWGKLHLKFLRLNLSELSLVEDQEGRTNLETVQKKLEKAAAAKSKNRTNTQIEFTGIDTLNLTMGKVNYYSLKTPNKNRVFDIGVKNEIIRNVKSEADLSGIILKTLLRLWYLRGSPPPPFIMKTPAEPDGKSVRTNHHKMLSPSH